MRPSLGCWRWRALGKIQKLSLSAAGLQLSHYSTNLFSLAQKALNSSFFGIWPWEWHLYTERFNLDKSLFLYILHIFRPTSTRWACCKSWLQISVKKWKPSSDVPFCHGAGLLSQGLPSRRCWLIPHPKSFRPENSPKDHLVQLWTSSMQRWQCHHLVLLVPVNAAQLWAGLPPVPPPESYRCRVLPAGTGGINGELIKWSWIFC